jgi:hypothetical protein
MASISSRYACPAFPQGGPGDPFQAATGPSGRWRSGMGAASGPGRRGSVSDRSRDLRRRTAAAAGRQVPDLHGPRSAEPVHEDGEGKTAVGDSEVEACLRVEDGDRSKGRLAVAPFEPVEGGASNGSRQIPKGQVAGRLLAEDGPPGPGGGDAFPSRLPR